MKNSKFPLGRTVITSNALASIPQDEVLVALSRHAAGDWGDLEAEDQATNEQALRDGSRLFSVYRSAAGVRFYVITEWNRSMTTVLLPEEY